MMSRNLDKVVEEDSMLCNRAQGIHLFVLEVPGYTDEDCQRLFIVSTQLICFPEDKKEKKKQRKDNTNRGLSHQL